MKLLAFSDLHCDLDQAAELVELAQSADVVISAGDLASVHKRLEETVAALSAIEKPTVLVAGNNETAAALEDACAEWPIATVLHGSGAEIEGTSFFGLGGGIPTTPWDWSFDLTEEEASEMLVDCPEGGVLVVHSPPKGHVDLAAGSHFGSESILTAIGVKQPVLALCGHIHDCWGQESTVGATRVLNLGPQGRLIEI